MQPVFKYSLLCTLVALALAPAPTPAQKPAYKTGHASVDVPANKAELFHQATQSYGNNKYADALTQLTEFHKQANFEDPKLKSLHDKTHYFMGLSYQGLNQVMPAKKEFAWVYQTSKDARLRYNSQVAFQQLAYYETHRSYAGQGNVFSRNSSSSSAGRFASEELARQFARDEARDYGVETGTGSDPIEYFNFGPSRGRT